jgi:DNA-binding CsgD family transcriptional regulator
MFRESDHYHLLKTVLQTKEQVKDDAIRQVTEPLLAHPAFNGILRNSDQCVRIIEHQTFKYLYVSENIKEIVGYTAERFIKGGITFTYSHLHPADFLGIIRVLSKIWKALGTIQDSTAKLNSRFKFDCRFRCSNGQYKRILNQGHFLSLDSKNKPAIVMYITMDISKLKKRNTIDYELSTYYPDKGFVSVLENWESVDESVPISLRELEVLKLISDGMTGKEIANRLFISEETVQTHRKKILQKTGLQNTTEVVKVALTNGWF